MKLKLFSTARYIDDIEKDYDAWYAELQARRIGDAHIVIRDIKQSESMAPGTSVPGEVVDSEWNLTISVWYELVGQFAPEGTTASRLPSPDEVEAEMKGGRA